MNDSSIKVIYKPGSGEVVEKKSRFLSFAVSAESEEEVLEVLEAARKKYWDARHVCYAYILGNRGENRRFSDDGEPAGTAGKPILEVLSGAGVVNTLIIVVRYFGGVLLGTGGLVRAYGQAAKEALAQAAVVTKSKGHVLTLSMDYTLLGKINYLLANEELTVLSTEYGEKVVVRVPVESERLEKIKKKLMDQTGGTIGLEVGDELYFCIIDGKAELI